MEIPAARSSSLGALLRLVTAVVLALAMFAFGFTVYFAAGYLKVGSPFIQRPDQTTAPSLPGTMYVVQGGVIYKFKGGSFVAVTSDKGWMQPAATSDGKTLVAVKRDVNHSDLYEISGSKTPARLTDNSSKQVEGNHWIFYPRFSPDGSQLFYDFDPKDRYNSYRVDLAILASPALDLGRWQQWTTPNQYTGGDTTPIPLRGGGLIYTKFSIDVNSGLHSQIWFQARAGSTGVPLTAANLDCIQPAVSPDETELAMVCRKGQTQTAELDVATLDASAPSLTTPRPLVVGALVASPTFSPDGKTIAYLAPARKQGPFQLWTVRASGSPDVKQITTSLGLDAGSAPLWVAR